MVNHCQYCKVIPDVSTNEEDDLFAMLDQDSSELGEFVSQIHVKVIMAYSSPSSSSLQLKI